MNLYHVTSINNLDSIKEHGLLSLKELEKRGLKYSSGSNNLSKKLDKRKNIHDYIKLTSNPDAEQIYILKERITNREEVVFVIKIDDKVLKKEGTLYSDINSADNKAKINSKSSTFYNSNSKEKEVLIRNKIEASFLLNIDTQIHINDATEDEYSDVKNSIETLDPEIANEAPTSSRICLNGFHNKMIHDSGFYEGEWSDSKRHGMGTQTWNEGSEYRGTWLNDEMNGQGIFSWKSGITFEGNFLNGRFADGKLLFLTGDFYKGSFKSYYNGGKGIFTFSNGDRYEGGFKNTKKHGRGMLYEGSDIFKVKYDHGELVLKQNQKAVVKKKTVAKKKTYARKKNSDSHIDRLIAQTNNKSTDNSMDYLVAIVLFYILFSLVF